MRIYLDTNIIVDFFINQIKHMKQGEALKIPSKLKFLSENPDKIKVYTSFLTKAEVMRKLISEYSATEQDIELLWEDFIRLLSCGYVEKTEISGALVDIVSRIPMKKKTMVNFIHLLIAKESDCYFLTGDEEAIRKIRETKFYDKAISYEELRQMFP